MKQMFLLFLVVILPFSTSSYAQESQEEEKWEAILQAADTSSLIAFMRQFEPWKPWGAQTIDIQDMQKNDTALAANAVMRTMLKTYQADLLKGVSRYKKYTQWPKQIIVQPEVEVCFVSTPEVDYRSIFAGKYIYFDLFTKDDWLEDGRLTGGRLDQFPPLYSEIPDLIRCKKYRYRRWNVDSQYVILDTLAQMRLERYFLERVDLFDREKINAIIPVRFGRMKLGKHKGEPFASLSYNIWINKVIFNPGLDQCIVQASTRQSPYEVFLIKINDEWIVVYNTERMHFDYLNN